MGALRRSATVPPVDVLKAARRAGLVAKALNAPAYPVFIGQYARENTIAAALEHGVAIIAIEPPPV